MPMSLNANEISAAWARLGIVFNVNTARCTPDVERLLVETARHARANVRLFTLAGTWLRECRDYVSVRRLEQIVAAELEDEHRPTLGLLLESACGPSAAKSVARVIGLCRKSVREGRPLARVEECSKLLARLSRSRATPLSLGWGLWASSAVFEPKSKAVRPVEWVAAHNPRLARRAGQSELAAYILAEWAGHEAGSVAEIARRAGVTRQAAQAAVRRLRLAGWAEVRREGLRTVVAVVA